MTFAEAVRGSAAPAAVLRTLALVEVSYVGFDGLHHSGQLVVAKDLAAEVQKIFSLLFEKRFPIERITPIVAYQWNDEASMADNNTSAFNHRIIEGLDKLSNHSFGRAIDINPMQNPLCTIDGRVYPTGVSYSPQRKGTIIAGDYAVKTFLSFGWEWGGHWDIAEGRIDYQHFQKQKQPKR